MTRVTLRPKQLGIAALGTLTLAGSLLATLPGNADAAVTTRDTPTADCPTPPAGQSKPWLDQDYSSQCRAAYVVRALPDVDQKITALTDENETFADMGITVPTPADGPQGDSTGQGATQFPAQVVVGASWNPATAKAFGDAVGEEFRARNKTGVLSPDGDIVRTWRWGRQSENYGEDPYLQSRLIGPHVEGIQQNKVTAWVKHLTAYNQESGRAGDAPTAAGEFAPPSFPNDEHISRKALNEIYMAPHAAAAEAGASGFMCSFPKINGTHACESAYVMDKMREEHGFEGSIVPDYPNAQHSVADSLNAGCDACSTTYGGTTLAEEVAAGRVPVSTLDRMIYNRVIASFRIGLTDDPPAGEPNQDDVRTSAHAAVSREIAADGAVLLKNTADTLPLTTDTESIAVIGPSAKTPVSAISGAGHVPPAEDAVVTPLQGIRANAPAGVDVSYAQGAAPVGQQADTALLPPLNTSTLPTLTTQSGGGEPGLRATYFGTPDWTGPALMSRVEDGVSLDGGIPDPALAPGSDDGSGGRLKVNGWSVRYGGTFTAPSTGTYVFSMGTGGESTLYVDGREVARNNPGQFGTSTQVAQHFRKGQRVGLRLDFSPRAASVGIAGPHKGAVEVAPTIKLGPWVELGMTGPDTPTDGSVAAPDSLIRDAVAKAKRADVAVLFLSESEGEGVDRSTMALPGAQDRLVEAVARANPNTVVVLNTGGAVAMPWLPKVKSVLEMWYPGEQFGNAAADLLFGDASPGGRLPITWPASERQGPGQTEESWPGVMTPDTTHPTSWEQTFTEGVNVGYRYWDEHHQRPLFAFGHGLSYTEFRYGRPRVTTDEDGHRTVTVRVTNTGDRAGSAVPQLYVDFPHAAGEAPWNLKGFEKLRLGAGESRTVSFPLGERELRVYDEDTDGWQVVPGRYTVAVGSSARDLGGRAQLRIH